MFAKMLRFIKYLYLRFIRLKGDPLSLAKGIAIGVFVGQTPTIPFQTVISLSLALLFRAAKIPALLSSMLTTPFTYFASWKIGNWLTPWDISWDRIAAARSIVRSEAGLAEKLAEFGKLGQETIIAMLLGGFVWAAPFAIISFIASYYFFVAVRNKRLKKHTLFPE
ncbi:MAG: DUF2062 domain-containing protein [Deltaproteobacteria bacterium]|jgi:uncharacterized protein (DUF2062 family)|nr:DUF2062 domain-containing protein [Deltaproteobacteria bacterium]MDD3619051.1 DUF2062 domain-containing protein [Desulfobulbaceae bacterium]